MAHKAFVIGANQPDLEFARSDGEKIRKALLKQGYEVSDLPSKEATDNEVDDAIYEWLEKTEAKEEIFLFYFAGHGVIDGGRLYLALESSELSNKRTMLSVADVIETIGDKSNGKSRNRMIILDCCHAGKIHQQADLFQRFNLLILCASKDTKVVPEIPALKGAFLTHYVARALSGEVKGASNRRNKVTPLSLTDWLNSEVDAFNKKNPEIENPDIQLAGIAGDESSGFWLASIETKMDASTLKVLNMCDKQTIRIESLERSIIRIKNASSAEKPSKEQIAQWENDFEEITRQLSKLDEDITSLRNNWADEEREIEKNRLLRAIESKEDEIKELGEKIDKLESTVGITFLSSGLETAFSGNTIDEDHFIALIGLKVRHGDIIDAFTPIFGVIDRHSFEIVKKREGKRVGGTGGGETMLEIPGFLITGINIDRGYHFGRREVVHFQVIYQRLTSEGLDENTEMTSAKLGSGNYASNLEQRTFHAKPGYYIADFGARDSFHTSGETFLHDIYFREEKFPDRL